MVFTAPAKVNLYLKILCKRDDGYHKIETLFEKISLCDEISIDRTEGDTVLICDNPSIPTDKNSLLSKTVELFREKSGISGRFKIKLKKNIPAGAGLGGGSSDAAAVLKGLNEITGTGLGKNEILDIARTLGADVPFFLSESSFAYGKERGDVMQEIKTPLKIWHVLINPPFKLSTKDVYGMIPSAFGLTKNIALDRMFTAFLDKKDIAGLAKNLHNDLQPIVLREFPVLEHVFSELRNAGAKGVLLCGSGSAVFGIFEQNKADHAAAKLRRIFPEEENWRVDVACTY